MVDIFDTRRQHVFLHRKNSSVLNVEYTIMEGKKCIINLKLLQLQIETPLGMKYMKSF